jgi:glycosyltransferase involved in cell wall biosynthesis
MDNILSIVIPCKNEEKYIGKLLESLSKQKGILNHLVIIADAGSSDNTLYIVNEYLSKLNIKIVDGGLPAIGRNNGAKASNSKYILFVDADAYFKENDVIQETLTDLIYSSMDLLTIKLNSDILPVKILYKINNFITYLSKLDKPFATGMFMMMRRDRLIEYGGFPEDAMHCEDFLLSKKFDRGRFLIVDKNIYSDDRRFKKMGYLKMIFYIIKNIINRNNDEYFKKDINYWK